MNFRAKSEGEVLARSGQGAPIKKQDKTINQSRGALRGQVEGAAERQDRI